MLSPDHPNFFEIVVTRPNRHSGFTLIEIVMVLVLSGILTAVAVPKYFDLQEEARMKAASAAIAEAQSRINATFAQKVLTGASCLEAIGAINASMADGQDKTFGEFQLVFGNLPTDGSTVDVSVKMGSVALGTGPLGTLAAVKCTDPDSGSNRPAATGPSSLNGFSQITQTGQCTSAGTDTSGVVAKYPQGNCSHASTEDMIAIAEQAFGELLASLGSPFNSLEDVGYWRYLDGGTGTKSLIWTDIDISGITTLQRVPFIQAQQDAQGKMTYYVGLVSVTGVNGQGAILVQDGWKILSIGTAFLSYWDSGFLSYWDTKGLPVDLIYWDSQSRRLGHFLRLRHHQSFFNTPRRSFDEETFCPSSSGRACCTGPRLVVPTGRKKNTGLQDLN